MSTFNSPDLYIQMYIQIWIKVFQISLCGEQDFASLHDFVILRAEHVYTVFICRPGKNVCFPASWAKFPSSRVNFPPAWEGFPYVFLYFFPPNHKISQQGASHFDCFFQACLYVLGLFSIIADFLHSFSSNVNPMINYKDHLEMT